MKKKILLMLAVMAMLVCIFAISVSAATVYKTADGETLFSYVDEDADYDFDSYEGSFPKTDADGNALTWYITATVTEGSDTVHTVASLKTLGEAGTINDSGAYSFTSPVTNKNTVSVNFPDNAGIKTWNFNTFGGYKTRTNNNILFVYCPNTLTAFANNPFQETQVIVAELDDETPITNIPQNFAHEARNLEVINIPASVTLINGNNSNNGAPFYNNYSLISVTFASAENLTELKNSCFRNCKSLVSIKLPESVEKIGDNCFAGCSSLVEVSLPNSLETIANHAFAWCTSLEIIRMGNSFEYFNNTGDNSFTYSAGKVREIYIPKSFYATAPDTSSMYKVSYAFAGVTADCKFFYCGTVDEFATAKANFSTQVSATTNNDKFLNAKVITYAEYLADTEAYATGNYVICGYNACDAFYESVHVEDNNPCVINCDRCGADGVAESNPVHSISTTITYIKFDNAGTKTTACTNEGCTHRTTEEVPALFTCLGYSAPENGTGGIAIGFTVNNEAITEYEEITGTTVKYGVFAVLKNKLGTNDIFAEDGALAEGAIAAEISNHEFSAFELKIVGFTDTQKEIKLAMGAFVEVVTTDGETTTSEYSYMQDGTPNEGEKYYFVSYNDIVKPSTDTDTPATDTGVTE